MNIALAQLNYHIGNFAENTAKIIENISKAKKEGADLIVFSELCISGYPPRDFLEYDFFIEECYSSVEQIAKHCVGIAAIVGAPVRNPNIKGKPLLNAALFLNEGEIEFEYNKALLPDYDVFDEYRYFEPGSKFHVFKFKNKTIALTICEDLWNIGNEQLYTVDPLDELSKYQPDLVINIAASPFHYEQAETRRKLLSANSKKYELPIVYVNQVGSQTELLFDGGSMALNELGEVVTQMKMFTEDFKIIDFGIFNKSGISESMATSRTALIKEALIMGIREYFSKMGFSKAILGLSGGIDSAVVIALAAEALGKENVLGVLLPSQFSSVHSIEDAIKLSNNLGTKWCQVPIGECYHVFEQTLAPYFSETKFDLTEENIQARIRAVILMAFSNKFGYITLNTSNKSEAAVGYGTLYGDMCGGLSVIGDVYKTQVWELAEYINFDKEIIPKQIIEKPPSAELRPDQFDSDSLPDYNILDKILYQYIENRKSYNEIVQLGFDEKTVIKVLKLVNSSEYKRYQSPPILRVSPKAFGMGRRMPIVAKY